jgi:glycine oxidase
LEAILGRQHLSLFRSSPFYNMPMRAWDVIIVGGGIIGLSLSIELRKKGTSVLVVERGEPGREASYAAGGTLVDYQLETPAALQTLASASARLYPEFAHDVEIESGIRVDLRDNGTILFPTPAQASHPVLATSAPESISELEPALASSERSAFYLHERSVDPRALSSAAWRAAKHRGVDFSSGDEVTAVIVSNGRVAGVTTTRTSFRSPKVVNCAGAWSGHFGPHIFPTRPVKGQMLCLIMQPRELIKHVIRTPDVYLIPRSDGRLLVGASIEEAGFDKRTDVATIKRLHNSALALVAELRNAKILESWAGLRPGTPDSLPILGATEMPGYYVATGHFRDGILLAPITARVMAEVITESDCQYNLTPFSPSRFSKAGD